MSETNQSNSAIVRHFDSILKVGRQENSKSVGTSDSGGKKTKPTGDTGQTAKKRA